jgi:hypothetical protein
MDLKFAIRSLRKNPGFTLLAIAVMASVWAPIRLFSALSMRSC